MTAPDLGDLYQEVILDHNRQPRNFGTLPGASHTAEGFNPLCGDRVVLDLRMDGARIAAAGQRTRGCAL